MEKFESQEALLKAFNDTQKEVKEKQKALEDAVNNNQKLTEDFKEEVKSLKENFEALEGINEKLNEQIESFEAKILDVKDFPSAEKMLDSVIKESEESLGKLKSKEVDTVIMHVKGVGDNTVEITDLIDSTLSQRVPGVAQEPVRNTNMSSFFQNITLGENNRGKVTYTEQNTLIRNADTVNRCALIPSSDTDWIEKFMDITKIGDSIKLCKDALEDASMLRGEVLNFIRTNILLKEDYEYLLGDGTYPNMESVDTKAVDWAAGTLAGMFPNAALGDVITSGIMQVKKNGQLNMYSPNIILLAPETYYKIKNERNADQVKVVSLDPQTGINRIDGVRVVESMLVPENEAYIMDTRFGTIYRKRGLTLAFYTQNEDDAKHDLILLVGTMRSGLLIKDIHNGAFLHVPSMTAALDDLKIAAP